MTVKTYDEKTYELASHFLENEPGMFTHDKCHKLALEIQTVVEDWINDERINMEPPDPLGWEGGFADNH